MGSASKHQHDPPLRFCPYARFSDAEDEFRAIQFGESPNISNFEESSSSSHIRPLDWCDNKESNHDDFSCEVCGTSLADTPFYSCKECPRDSLYLTRRYHKECLEPISKHPYHSKHSLRLIYDRLKKCLFCSFSFVSLFYTCSTCDLIMCLRCTKEPPVLTIDHPKRHEHALFYFLRKGILICDVCGLSDNQYMIFSCHQCDFIVHKECAYFPCTIRISRHQHRLSFNSSLSPEKWLCGVCRIKIDTNYGRYSCVDGCSYGVHSRCATRNDVWDGKELEGIPEYTYEDTKSFIEVSDGVIQHFSHLNHHMRLDMENNREFDEHKRCKACTLPIFDVDIIYRCMHCDFILHQTCAHLPRKNQHPLHPFLLSQQIDNREGYFRCIACHRASNGFSYTCNERGCDFTLDVRCASVSEPLDYQCHQHLFFLTSNPQSLQTCSICQITKYTLLNCGECGFVLCFQCATLPNKMRYKYDEHVLLLSFDKDARGQYWCDVCEEEADPKRDGVYMCNDCNITLHIKCLLGEDDIYMMPGETINVRGVNVYVLPKKRLFHKKCDYCHRRCKNKVVYQKSVIGVGKIFCSYNCVLNYVIRNPVKIQ